MTDNKNADSPLKPASFEPPEQRRAPAKRRLRPLLPVAALLALALLFGLWFVLTATAIKIQIEPSADELELTGGLVIELGGNHLLRPGRYTVVAEKPGYHPLEEIIEVAADGPALFRFDLDKLPGLLTLTSEPKGAEVVLDGKSLGRTPLSDYSLESGDYRYALSAPRYQPAEGEIAIEGLGRQQRLHVELDPLWADITLRSQPPGASVLVDGEEVGRTGEDGFVAEIMPGKRTVGLRLEGYQPWDYSLLVVANEAQTLPPVVLTPSYGLARVDSKPGGARVLVNGEYRGLTPLDVELRPDSSVEITAAKAGYRSAVETVKLASGEEKSLSFTLQPVIGEIAVSAEPADALLYIDGILRGRANQTVKLTATEHRLEIRKEGYATHRQTVTPRGGVTQRVTVKLLTEREAFLAQFPKQIETSTGERLRRVEPGTQAFAMGSPRREQGRQANEVQRDVKLTRLFYIGTHEVTNESFRQFRAQHSSGIVQRTTLDNDNYPVARVSWSDAVAFCNWLSKRDGLPPAYRNGKLVQPVTTGYRLPTEAEWAWVARYSGGLEERSYPWGNTMPPTGKAGNFADVAAQGLVGKTLSEYNDGYPAAAPVGRFDPNPLGVYDLGGNVSEWVNDVYGTSVATSTEVDPLGEGDGELHVIRGSSWRHGRITELRVVYRDSGADGRDDVGFRLARYAN